MTDLYLQEQADLLRKLRKGFQYDAIRFAEADSDGERLCVLIIPWVQAQRYLLLPVVPCMTRICSSHVYRTGNRLLPFEEFLAVIPQRMRKEFTDEQIQVWFSSFDIEQDGTLTFAEYAAWSLTNGARRHGAPAMVAIFKKWDPSGDGQIDAIEFAKAAEWCGWSAVATELFAIFDNDGSGTINYGEFLQRAVQSSPQDAELLADLTKAFYDDTRTAVDTSDWVIRGSDASSVRTNLRLKLVDSETDILDLVRMFEGDNEGMDLSISATEFSVTMRQRLGYRGEEFILDEVFKSLSPKAGKVGFDQLYEFIIGHRHSLDPRNRTTASADMCIQIPDNATLDTVAWSASVLHAVMKDMCTRCGVGPVEMLGFSRKRNEELSRDGDGVTLQEWLHRLHKAHFAAAHPDLWENEVQPAATDAFETILNDNEVRRSVFHNKRVCIVRLSRWLIAPSSYASVNDLPVKTRREIQQQLARRKRSDITSSPANSHEALVAVKARAAEGITAAAAASARRKLAEQMKAEERTRQLRKWGELSPQRWEGSQFTDERKRDFHVPRGPELIAHFRPRRPGEHF